MTEHYIAYRGALNGSLAAMNRDYLGVIMKSANDLRVTAGILMRPPITLEAETEWFERNAKRSETDQVFAILYHEPEIDGQRQYRYIGHTGLHKISWPDGIGSTGSVIFEKDLHRSGVGTEAKLLLLYHAFFVKGLRKVCSQIKAFNGNSWGHLLKCGYRQVGRSKRHHFHEGTFVDEIMFEVFREDFEPIWERYQGTATLPKLTDEQKELITKA